MILDFVGRLGAAVRRRCGGAVSLKTLAVALDVSDDTLARWLDGRTRCSGERIDAMARFFAAHGDHDFLREVYGAGNGDPAVARLADLCLWISPAGTLHHAPLGHQQFITGALGADGLAGDVAAHAVRLRGWIAAVLRADGHLTLRLAPVRARPAAIARAIQLLSEPRGTMAGLVVELVSGHDVAVQPCDTLAAARRLLERIGAAAVDARPTTVKLHDQRLRFGVAAAPAMVVAAQAWDGPCTDAAAMLAAIAEGGGIGNAALFLARPDGYRCQDLGAALRVDPAVIGRSLEDLYDVAYWRLVARHYDIALDEGPTLHRIEAATADDDCTYDRAAWPVLRGGEPAVLTVSHLIQAPRAAVLQ